MTDLQDRVRSQALRYEQPASFVLGPGHLQLDLVREQVLELCAPANQGADPSAAAIQQSLEVASAAQRLQLASPGTSAAAEAQHGGEDGGFDNGTDPEGGDFDFEGSRDVLLGISQRDLTAAHSDSMRLAQEALRDRLPELSAAVEQQCAWLAEACGVTGECNGANEVMHAVGQLAHALCLAQEEREEVEERCVCACEALVETHMQLCAYEDEAVQAYITAMRSKQEQDQMESSIALSKHGQSLKSLQAVEADLLRESYSEGSTKALEQVLRLLTQASDSYERNISQVRDEIIQREKLGTEYAQLALQYGASQQLIRDLRQS